jgi:hypothetical protein
MLVEVDDTSEELGQVIGAGGYGKVYRLKGGDGTTVLKAIYKAQSCRDAHHEFQKQRKAYESLMRQKQSRLIRVAEPLRFSEKPFVLNGIRFSCSLTMRLLHGLPLRMFLEYDRAHIESRFDPHYLATLDVNQFQLQAHLAFNSDIGGVYGRCYSCGRISEENPPRGYFITPGSGFLQFLRDRYGLTLSDETLKETIGFIYGRLFYDAQLAPVDIEITLGYNATLKQFEVNVLDFGMTYDLVEQENNVPDLATEPFYALEARRQRGELNEEAWHQAVQKQALRMIDVDLYAPMDDTAVQMQFYNAAKVAH